MTKCRFVYGRYYCDYELTREERKTVRLAVTPDSRITVISPKKATDEQIEKFLRRKWTWINKQLREFGKYKKNLYPKEYVSGESFLYLGRQYQLTVLRGNNEGVSLVNGRMMVTTKNPVRDGRHNERLILGWYKARATAVFRARLTEAIRLVDPSLSPQLTIKKMTKRWGSYVGRKKIILNPRLINASKECIDYVIMHELCHFQHKRHDKKFFAMLTRIMPNWEKIKEKLETRWGVE